MLEKQQNELSTLTQFLRYSLGNRAPKGAEDVADPNANQDGEGFAGQVDGGQSFAGGET